jgi:MYXO-CTERM domain-containing protein
VVPVAVAHAVPLLPPLVPGPGDGILPANDDGSSPAIALAPAFPEGLRFFGGPYMSMYVNNNGNITFNGSLGTYTPNPFPVATQPMIAPYWADIDTRGGGSPTNNSVFWHIAPGRVQISWHNVGYFNTRDDLKMDFQLILTSAAASAAGDFDVEFRYNRCEWETGDASGGASGFGGTPAQAGFDAGNLVDFVEIPGSRAAGIARLLCTTSNVGEPGIWRFSVREGGVFCAGMGAPCETGELGACSVGIGRCMGTGTSVCAPLYSPAAERCDHIDNDCNGTVDDVGGECLDAGVPPVPDGGPEMEVDAGEETLSDAGPSDGGAPRTDAAVGDTPPTGEPFLTRYGCGCTVPVGAPTTTGMVWIAGMLGILAWRRRRRSLRLVDASSPPQI